MPDIYDWSTTAADNDDADSGINWLEGQLPGTVNGSARAMMKRHADWLDDYGAVGTVGGTADAITLTSAISSLASGKRIAFKAGADNTGATTINVNGLGAKAIRKMTGGTDAALAAGDIKSGVRYDLIYDAAANSAAGAWILLVHTRLVYPATITPQANDGAALGTSSLSWSDLFLASGGVINFNNGDAAITHSADSLTLSAGNAPTDVSAIVLNNNGISLSHNVGTGILVADSSVAPNTTDTMALGTTASMFSDLFLASGAVINFDNGDVTLTHSADTLTLAGGLLSLTSGQIKFPASQNASTDANTLDDYEEGTWTPIDSSGATLSLTASGVYTKIGREVTARGKVVYPVTADGSISVIGGFPFTSANVDGAQSGFIAYTTDATPQKFLLDKNATTGKFYNSTGGNVTNATLSGDTLWITVVYHI